VTYVDMKTEESRYSENSNMLGVKRKKQCFEIV